MVGKNFTDVKLSRKDRVTTITGARSVHARLPQHCKCVLDGGHLLHVVPWPTAATYKQVWEPGRHMAHTQCNTTEVNRLLCAMVTFIWQLCVNHSR